MIALRRRRQNLRPASSQQESSQRTRPSSRQYNSTTFITSVAGLSYSPKISINDLAKVEPDFVGQGGSFRVEKTNVESSTSPPRVVVLKRPVLVDDDMDASKHWKAVLLEILALMHPPLANHENIVDLLAIGWDSSSTDTSSKPEWPILVMPYATHGTLASFQHSSDATLSVKYSLCLDVARGLSILHSCSIVHGDLKNENVLIFAESRGLVARLCDFGCSLVEIDELDSLLAGSEPWNAPEWKDKLQRKTLVLTDVYSFGLLIWRVISEATDPIKELSLLAGSRAADLDSIERLKRKMDDSFLVALKKSTSIEEITSESQRESIKEILELTVRADSQKRKLGEAVKKLEKLVLADSSTLDARPICESDDAGTPVEFLATSELQLLNKQSWLHQVQIFKTFQEQAHAGCQGPSNAEQSESEFGLFFCYLLGIGVKPDAKLAFGSLSRSALAEQPVARTLIHRASLVLEQPFPEAIELGTRINWLARGIELGFFQAREDFLDLIDSQREDAIAEKKYLREIYALAVSRLRNYTAGIGKGYFLDAAGERLGSFRIDNEQQFQIDVKEKAEDKEFNINKFLVNDRGDLVLHFVATCGAGHAVRFLIEHFHHVLDINAVNQEGETALLSASRAGQAETVCLLLSNGADLRCSKAGENPLHWLSAFDDEVMPKVVELMVESHSVLRTDGRATYLHQKASLRKSINIPHSTLPSGTPLHRAVWLKNLKVVSKLLDLGADPEERDSDEQPRSALYLASKYHLSESLRVMLEKKGTQDVNLILGPSLLHAALSVRDDLQQLIVHGTRSQIQALKTIMLLMELKANPGPIPESADPGARRTALFEAVESGWLFGVELCLTPMLLESKDLVNARCGELLLTPLQMAVQNGSLEIVQTLLKAGADARKTSGKESLTTLHYCASMNMTSPHSAAIFNSIIPFFKDVDLDQRPQGAATAFVRAVHLLHFDIASFLLDKEVDIDAEFSGLGENVLMRGEPMTILGLVVQQSTLNALAQIRFLLGLDSQGKKRKDWRHPLPSGITSKQYGATVFHVAAMRRRLPIYAVGIIKEILGYLLERYPKELLDYQAKSNSISVGTYGFTALHIAAFTTNIEVLTALLRAGANKDIVDACGMKPIEYAIGRMQEGMEVDAETGWTETIVRKEVERRKMVYLLLGGSMEIFKTAEVSDLETKLELYLQSDGSSESE